jgi:hypothetical protein
LDAADASAAHFSDFVPAKGAAVASSAAAARDTFHVRQSSGAEARASTTACTS